MCVTCGCSDSNKIVYTDAQTGVATPVPRDSVGATGGGGFLGGSGHLGCKFEFEFVKALVELSGVAPAPGVSLVNDVERSLLMNPHGSDGDAVASTPSRLSFTAQCYAADLRID